MIETVIRLDSDADARQIMAQIDAIVPELLALRRQLNASLPASAAAPRNLTTRLYGALGHGDWNEYDMELDWVRFGTQ